MSYRIIAFTGLPMSGKSTAREQMQAVLDGRGIPQAYVHFGSTEEVERRDAADEWPEEMKHLTMEQKERFIREKWREEMGMGAMAEVKLPEIKQLLTEGKVVLIDNLYSDEERSVLTDEFGEEAVLLVATAADWETRVKRGAVRPYRPLTAVELATRDHSEVYNLHKAPTIALAHVTIANNGEDPAEIREALEKRVLPLLAA